jgi:hypothetical protein
MEQVECSETSANINQTPTPGKHPKENTLNSEHGESLKSRKVKSVLGGTHRISRMAIAT